MTFVSMGNPHLIFICSDPWQVPLEKVGQLIEFYKVLPTRVNIHFVSFDESSDKAVVRTWERGGNGVSLACGTGVSAVCVAGVL